MTAHLIAFDKQKSCWLLEADSIWPTVSSCTQSSSRIEQHARLCAAQSLENIQPVAGWLVCVEGASKARDNPIHAGYNTIGHSS
ncbi:MAG: hypothetical protein ACRESZ_17860 [Methylococcales bacterium]